MANDPLLQIQIHGANVAIIGGRVLAALIPPPNAVTWVATSLGDGTIRFTDQAGGLVLGATDTAPGTPAVVAPADTLAVSSWQLTEYSDDAEDDPTPVKDAAALQTGYYAVREPTTGAYLYRNRIEDRSLLPKPVSLQPADLDQGPLIINIVG